MGFDIIDAKDGEEGLNRLEELYLTFSDDIDDHLKIIISDVEMPKMDGYHFASKVKSDDRFKEIPIIFNSSISDHFSNVRAESVGGEGYLVKFDASRFYDEVSRVINKHLKE
jgi:two-component system chemotaxis response regulator CheV